MIRQIVEVYIKLFKVSIFLIAAAGMTVGGIDRESKLANQTLLRGLVKIPEIGK
jgi:hypothetical protein